MDNISKKLSGLKLAPIFLSGPYIATPEYADAALKIMYTENIISDAKRDFYEATLTTPRVNTGLGEIQNVYTGGWYWQVLQPTCAVWQLQTHNDT